MERLRGKRAVVTGAGGGIGRATAKRLAAEGAAVAVIDVDVDAAQETVALIDGEGRTAVALVADLGDVAQVERSMSGAARWLGGIDVLVNNVGVAVPGSVTSLTPEVWDRVFAVNLKGLWLAMKQAIPHLRAAGGGAIVNLASIQALLGFAGWAGYAATKGAIVSLTRQAAVEYSLDGIRVNAVAPGTIMTPMNEALLRNADDADEVVRTWNSLHALGRVGQPEEVAAAIAFLASDDASFITGHCLPVDGGATILGAVTRSS